MAEHNRLGASGEKAACEYLQGKGYTIREMNWRSGKLELDIVAQKGTVLVFIEVKTRQNNQYGFPEEAITPAKIRGLYMRPMLIFGCIICRWMSVSMSCHCYNAPMGMR